MLFRSRAQGPGGFVSQPVLRVFGAEQSMSGGLKFFAQLVDTAQGREDFLIETEAGFYETGDAGCGARVSDVGFGGCDEALISFVFVEEVAQGAGLDRKRTCMYSSHDVILYAVECYMKKQ